LRYILPGNNNAVGVFLAETTTNKQENCMSLVNLNSDFYMFEFIQSLFGMLCLVTYRIAICSMWNCMFICCRLFTRNRCDYKHSSGFL